MNRNPTHSIFAGLTQREVTALQTRFGTKVPRGRDDVHPEVEQAKLDRLSRKLAILKGNSKKKS